MKKVKKILLVLFILCLLYFVIAFDIHILYPYYVLKDFVLSPVRALVHDEKMVFNQEYYESLIESLREDIEELKELNNLQNVLTDFNYLHAIVIERNRDYWFNTITINKGINDGVEVDMAVVSKSGLLGRISNVRRNTSDVKLITTNDVTSKISVVIKDDQQDVYGLITGYDSENNLLKVKLIGKDDVHQDSLVETTGLGGVFPKGILIGKVYDSLQDSDGVSIIVRVIPSTNVKGEAYVSVLQRKEMDY